MLTAQPITGLDKMTDGFDFLVGDWTVANRRMVAPLSGQEEWYETQATARATTLHNGAISIDEMWYAELGFAGSSIRVFTPVDGLWTIYWVNSTTGNLQPPVQGRWSEDGTEFVATGLDEFEGRPILARYKWHSIRESSATWEQAFSIDDGQTWETNWVMVWTRSCSAASVAHEAGTPGSACSAPGLSASVALHAARNQIRDAVVAPEW